MRWSYKMKNKKYIYTYLLVLLLVCILSISAISATENTTSKEISNTDNNAYTYLETTNHQHDDVTHSKNNNVEIKGKEKLYELLKNNTLKNNTINKDKLLKNNTINIEKV